MACAMRVFSCPTAPDAPIVPAMFATRASYRLLPVIAALVLAAAPAGAEILVGVAGPFSGPNATLGEQLKRGVQMAIDDLNATGGLRGERLAMQAADDGCDPKKAVEVATQLVSAGVTFVAGHYCSGASIPAAKVYEAASIIEISPASTHARFTDEGGWNVLRICPRDDAQGTAAGKLIAQRFAGKKIALVNDGSAMGAAQTARVREALAAAGLTPIIDEAYKPGAKDYAPLVQKLHDGLADVVYLGGTYVEGGQIVKALRDLGSAAQIVAPDSLLTEDYWNIAKEAGEGTLVTFMFDPQKFDAARPLLQRFRDADFNPEGHTLYAYAAVQAWVQAAEATGGTDAHRIADWLRAGNRLRTVTGEISFDAKGDLREPRIAWFRWRDGRYQEIDPQTLEPPELPSTP